MNPYFARSPHNLTTPIERKLVNPREKTRSQNSIGTLFPSSLNSAEKTLEMLEIGFQWNYLSNSFLRFYGCSRFKNYLQFILSSTLMSPTQFLSVLKAMQSQYIRFEITQNHLQRVSRFIGYNIFENLLKYNKLVLLAAMLKLKALTDIVFIEQEPTSKRYY